MRALRPDAPRFPPLLGSLRQSVDFPETTPAAPQTGSPPDRGSGESIPYDKRVSQLPAVHPDQRRSAAYRRQEFPSLRYTWEYPVQGRFPSRNRKFEENCSSSLTFFQLRQRDEVLRHLCWGT